MVRYFLKKLKELKRSHNITVVDNFLPGGGKDISQRKLTSSFTDGKDSMIPCSWNLKPTRCSPSAMKHQLSWCFQCFRFQGVSPIHQIFLVLISVIDPKFSGGFGSWRVHPTDGCWDLRFPGSNGCQGRDGAGVMLIPSKMIWEAFSSPRLWGYSTFYSTHKWH